MALGDELRVGKTVADLNTYGMGMEGSGIGSSPVTMPNTDYNSFRPTNVNNNIGKFGLLAQHTTVNFNSSYIDVKFGDKNSVGANPFLSDDKARQKYMQDGNGSKMFELV